MPNNEIILSPQFERTAIVEFERLMSLLEAAEVGADGAMETLDGLLNSHGDEIINLKGVGGLTPLHVAAKNGYQIVLKTLLTHESLDLNAQDNDELTALHLAADNGHVGLVDSLLGDTRLDLGIGPKGLVALHLQDNFFKVKALWGKPESTLEPCGVTALHLAARNGHDDVVNRLLKDDSSHDLALAKDENGLTALHLAAQHGHPEVVDCLLHHAPSTAAALDNYRFTALHLAAMYGHKAVAQSLLQHEPEKIHTKNIFADTALHLATWYEHQEVADFLRTRSTEILQECSDALNNLPLEQAPGIGAFHFDPQAVTFSGYSEKIALERKLAPFHSFIATHKSTVKSVATMYQNRLNWAAKGGDQAKLIHWASEDPGLLQHKDCSGSTALHIACEKGYPEMVQILVQHTPYIVDSLNASGRTALHLAADRGHRDVVDSLWKRVQEIVREQPPTEEIDREKGLAAVPQVADEKLDFINASDGKGTTALHLAAQRGHLGVVDSLLKIDCVEINAKTSAMLNADFDRPQPSQPSKHGYLEWVDASKKTYSAQIKAKPNLCGGVDSTALHLAAKNGHHAVVDRMLAEPSLDVNAKDADGYTALHCLALRATTPVLPQDLVWCSFRGEQGRLSDSRKKIVPQDDKHTIISSLFKHPSLEANAKDNAGFTALQLAAGNGLDEVIASMADSACDRLFNDMSLNEIAKEMNLHAELSSTGNTETSQECPQAMLVGAAEAAGFEPSLA